MTSQYRHRRTAGASTVFPTLEPGEIAVNTANRQIAIGDAQSGVLGAPLPAIAVRFFDSRAQYVSGDYAINAGVMYRANTTISPAAFNPTQWDVQAGAVNPLYVEVAGDVMTGMLTLPGTTPTLGAHATNKTYVDAQDALKADKTYVDSQDALKAPLASPTFTGDPKAPTPTAGDNDTSIATTAFVSTALTGAIAATGAVRFDAPQGLSTVQMTQGRQNIYAAPFDAMSYSGMQFNGSMDVSQERNTTITGAPGVFLADGFKLQTVGSAVFTVGQFPGTGIFPFASCIAAVVTTAQPSVVGSDYHAIYHLIEGWRAARLNWGTADAQPITIGFWTAHARTGIYTGTARNLANNRCCAFSYTQNASNVGQFNVVTIPGDTTGTWKVDSTIGIWLTFAIASNATFLAPAVNTWYAVGYTGAVGQVNGVAATSDVFRLTGVVVLPGSDAPSVINAPLVMRPYGQELLTSRRYFKFNASTIGHVYEASANLVAFAVAHDPPMRAAPTMAIANATGTVTRPGVASYNISSLTNVLNSPTSTWTLVTLTTSPLINVPAGLADGAISYDARL